MKNLQIYSAPNSRLRMVFDDAVVMLKLSNGATYGDIAALWENANDLHNGATVAIAVTVDPSLPLPSSWMYPAMCAAPSLSNPPLEYRFRRPASDAQARNFA